MNIGIVLDNDLNDDARVIKQIGILKKNHNVYVLCYDFIGKSYKNIEGVKVNRIKIFIEIKNFIFLLFNFIPLYEIFWSYKISKFIKKKFYRYYSLS